MQRDRLVCPGFISATTLRAFSSVSSLMTGRTGVHQFDLMTRCRKDQQYWKKASARTITPVWTELITESTPVRWVVLPPRSNFQTSNLTKAELEANI